MIIPEYKKLQSTPFPTITLENFISNVARQIGVIGLDSNDEIPQVIKSSIQQKFISTTTEFQANIPPQKILLTNFYNQIEVPLVSSVLMMRFSRSKYTERLEFDNEGVPEENREYFIQFDFDVEYISSIRVRANNAWLSFMSLRKTERWDFDRTCGISRSYSLEAFNGYKELRLTNIPQNTTYGQIEITGRFVFYDPCGENISPNYLLADDILYRLSPMEIEAFQDIVSYKVVCANDLVDTSGRLETLSNNAYKKFDKARSLGELRLG